MTGQPRVDFKVTFAGPLAEDARDIAKLDKEIKHWTNVLLEAKEGTEKQSLADLWIHTLHNQIGAIQMGELFMEIIWNLSSNLVPDYVTRVIKQVVDPAVAVQATAAADSRINSWTQFMLDRFRESKPKRDDQPENN